MNNNPSKDLVLNRIIFILSLAGLAMAVYVLQSFLRESSIICLTGGGCEAVRKNAVSWPFGIPVPAFGLVGYAGLTLLSFLKTLKPEQESSKSLNILLVNKIMLGIAIFGVCFVTWFTYMEIFVIKGICTWCAISAVNMYIILFLIMKSRKSSESLKVQKV
ncbi:vitamin K epoxide reductase family protein [Patescibacteria group bacterium]